LKNCARLQVLFYGSGKTCNFPPRISDFIRLYPSRRPQRNLAFGRSVTWTSTVEFHGGRWKSYTKITSFLQLFGIKPSFPSVNFKYSLFISFLGPLLWKSRCWWHSSRIAYFISADCSCVSPEFAFPPHGIRSIPCFGYRNDSFSLCPYCGEVVQACCDSTGICYLRIF
jgi:hypothetical protein